MLNPRQVITALKQNIGKVIVGKDEVIELLLIAMLCKGHVLIEDVPGTGKTTLASALAKSLDCSFNRIQFTPDVVPSDVTGFTMVNFKTGEMEFHPGAILLWRTRSTVPRPRRSRRCWRSWRNIR